MACKCTNIDIGSYKNQVTLINWWNGNYVCVDKCLMDEILELWDEQVQTTGCCCGHNKAVPYINALETDFEKMIELGYRWWKNEYGAICYEPKSVGKQLESENGKLPIPHVSKRCDIEPKAEECSYWKTTGCCLPGCGTDSCEHHPLNR